MAFNETSLSFSRFEGRLFIFYIFPHQPSSQTRVAKRKGLGSLVVSVTVTGLGRRRGGGGWAAGRPCSLMGPTSSSFLPPGPSSVREPSRPARGAQLRPAAGSGAARAPLPDHASPWPAGSRWLFCACTMICVPSFPPSD